MAKLTFDIPDNKVDIIINGWCIRYGYQSVLTEIQLDQNGDPTTAPDGGQVVIETPNPQSRIEFVKEKIRLMIRVETIRGLKLDREQVMNTLLSSDKNDVNSINIQ